MNQHKSLVRISELLSRFKVQVGILSASSMLDLNVVAEDFFIPVLNDLFDCELLNANSTTKNFPALDLIDNKKRTGFQITSTSSLNKVKDTVRKIIANKLYED